MGRKKKTNRRVNKSGIYFLVIAVVLLLVCVLSYVFIIPRLADSQAGQATLNQPEKKGYDAYASIASDNIQRGTTIFEYGWDLNDPYYFYNRDPIAALVHIDSIDGGQNYSPVSEQYVYPNTIGKMTVLKVYKGDIKPGQQLNYSRLGGIITHEEYVKGMDEVTRENFLSYGTMPKEKYVQKKGMDDIDIEVDKNYIVFLWPQTYKDGSRQEYSINGAQYGLREARGAGAEMTVLNNVTKKWESLSSIIKLH